MIYKYELLEKDIKKIGLQLMENTKKYFAVQNGWNGKFEGVYGITFKNSFRFDMELVDGLKMTEKQIDYIIKKCNCIES